MQEAACKLLKDAAGELQDMADKLEGSQVRSLLSCCNIAAFLVFLGYNKARSMAIMGSDSHRLGCKAC